MADPERRTYPLAFAVDVAPDGIILKNNTLRNIPHLDLIRAMMNAGACAAFNLRPSLNTEGGVEGSHRRTAINFENWGDETLGIYNTAWKAMDYMKPKEVDATNEVLGYYELFLTVMFESPIIIDNKSYSPGAFLIMPNLQTREAVW